MAGKQRDALEVKARSVLSGMGMRDFMAVEPRPGRPMHARLEIAHPLLHGYPRSEWWDQMKQMHSGETAAAVMMELAQMTKQLRDAGIRATADYALGTIVVSWGKPAEVDIDAISQSLAGRLGGQPVPGESALVAWAGLPASEVDTLTPALQHAIDIIAPGRPHPRKGDQNPGDPGRGASRRASAAGPDQRAHTGS